MPRTIGLYPEDRYTFRTNESFRQEWSFLPDNEKKAIIATQLTYLAFHGWLKSNLRHALQEVPEQNQWSELVFDVDEGFHRTDLLLFASICEAALNCVLRAIYDKDAVNAHPTLKRCYERAEDVSVTLNGSEFQLVGANVPTTGKLCLRRSSQVPVAESEIKFVSLISAGEELGIYDHALRERLDILRSDRNSIHLAQHLRINNQDGSFTRADRDAAAQIVEDFRTALGAYLNANPVA